jgi:hypothetical protein
VYGKPQTEGVPVDDTELKRLLEDIESENDAVQRHLAALQSRSSALVKAAEGIRALLEMPPRSVQVPLAPPVAAGPPAMVGSRQPEYRVPAEHGPVPKGKNAAKLILESDPSRFWTVRDVHDEEVRRGWAEFRPPGAPGNPPSRAALQRLHEDYPDNVVVQMAPVMAYKWNPETSRSHNGFGVAPYAEEDG